MDHCYYTYIVASVTGTLYIGITNNIMVRTSQHKSGKMGGFSARYKCNRLVYYEQYGDVRLAIDREKELKGWRRSKKVALIESMNPRWRDLSEIGDGRCYSRTSELMKLVKIKDFVRMPRISIYV